MSRAEREADYLDSLDGPDPDEEDLPGAAELADTYPPPGVRSRRTPRGDRMLADLTAPHLLD